MKRIKLLLLIIFLVNYLVGSVLAHSLEITTGSGNGEGIVNRNGLALKNGLLIQIINAYQGVIHPPGTDKKVSGGDEVLGRVNVGYGFPFDKDGGKFDCQVSVDAAKIIYVRAWLNDEIYGNSSMYKVQGYTGEFWNINGDKNVPAIRVINE